MWDIVAFQKKILLINIVHVNTYIMTKWFKIQDVFENALYLVC